MEEAPIGICDSGLGGLSVWREVRALLPQESLVYFADNAHCPYGPKAPEAILALCDRITQFFLQHHCKLILLACNTATAAAIHSLRTTYPLPFVGMEPAIKPAALRTQTGKVGILATKGTFRGGHFQNTKKQYAAGVEVMIQVGEGLVELVERGELMSPAAQKLLETYLLPMIENGVDQIVLGCSHYPFLQPLMESIVDGKAHIIDPAPAVAQQVKAVLAKHQLLNGSAKEVRMSFYTSGDIQPLKQMIRLISPEPADIRQVTL